ncbi:exosortase/archaeosortase family protein [Mesorhizobium sp. CU2]|uniref:archaeosortase/exosortase family protein n=1 Tax=unclassified Mesorhizobium TaxID=325217 RepID=UPI00112B368E|nr:MULTISPECIES: archaeosortase/exosortase family protein [unclassified Mesorhizobium]TPN85042.1 exosortase/archaeosortase family protein [Mesorhizobium sp. CU3]TPO13001.1 exosortase/archaeosortase family protein [Mesorhizobium sp. CU2]
MTVYRSQIYCGVVAVGFANGASDRVAESVARDGPILALMEMFGVSLIAWLAMGVTIWLLLHSEAERARRSDFVVACVAGFAFLIPLPQVSWLALAGVAAYLASTSSQGMLRRAAVLLGAVTVPMFWARIAFAVFGGPILSVDAKIVGWIVGTGGVGNTVPFADGSGVVFLLPACSSLTNLSLALLCGVMIVKLYDLRWSWTVIRALVAACLATVVVNLTRISLIGVMPAYYDIIHGTVGITLAELLTNLTVMAIYAGALRSDEPVHA